MFIPQCLIVKEKQQLPNCLKRAETDVVLSVLADRAYIVSFLSSLDMNQVPEKLYLGQNIKQHVMKEQRSAYKSYIEKNIQSLVLNYPDQNISNQFKPKKLLYIQSLGTDKKVSHQRGAMDRSQLTQSENPTSPTVSVRIHRGITRQHPRLHQKPTP